jgi:hypothetical protein
MARPLRRIGEMRTVVVRRRHRTWMLSMCLASLGWGVWWIEVFLARVAPEHAPSLRTTALIGGAFALPGLLVAIWTLRAKAAWILITLVPLLANLSLIVLPILIRTLRVIRES